MPREEERFERELKFLGTQVALRTDLLPPFVHLHDFVMRYFCFELDSLQSMLYKSFPMDRDIHALRLPFRSLFLLGRITLEEYSQRMS